MKKMIFEMTVVEVGQDVLEKMYKNDWLLMFDIHKIVQTADISMDKSFFSLTWLQLNIGAFTV